MKGVMKIKSGTILLGLALVTQGCAKLGSEAGLTPGAGDESGETTVGNTALPDGLVSLMIQGSKPLANAPALRGDPGQFFRLPGAFEVAAETPTSAAIDVKDTAGVSIGTLTLTDARLALKQIKLKRAEVEDENDIEAEAESERLSLREDEERGFDGPYVVNLITDEVSPSIEDLQLSAGVYKKVELKLHKITGEEHDDQGAQIADQSDGLYDNSIVLSGTYTGATAGGAVTDIPFALTFDLSEEIKLIGEGGQSVGFTVSEDGANPIVIAFRMVRWFEFSDEETNSDGVDFSQVVVTQDESAQDVIVLDKHSDDSNSEIREVIKDNIKKSADFGKDDDGNGKLESDEDDDEDELDDESENGEEEQE